jgi:uncharacterized repeat protein (TIGR01451 family)
MAASPDPVAEGGTDTGGGKPRADLKISVGVDADTVAAGSKVTYTFAVRNVGPHAASSVILTDTLPESARLVSCAATEDGSCRAKGDVVTVAFSSLPAGSLARIHLVVISSPATPPYPASPVLADLDFELQRLQRRAIGSDLWPVTWGPGQDLYTAWGDGGGFGGSESDGRVSMGFARITGFPQSIGGRNIWGGKDAPNSATFTGKPTGMLASDGTLYAWVLTRPRAPSDVRLATSFDASRTWQLAGWSFRGHVGGFYPLTFLNFGRNNTGARDGFVYVYGKRWSAGDDPYASDHSYLARVPRGALDEPARYEFYAGRSGQGAPRWTPDFGSAFPVLSDPSGIDAPAVVYHHGLQRYLATTAHSQEVQKLSVFDADEPWGRWTTVVYHDNWGELGSSESLGFSLPAKWIDSADGTVWMVFSARALDAFNLVPGKLVLRPGGRKPGAPGTRVRNTARVSASGSVDPVMANNTATAEITVVD